MFQLYWWSRNCSPSDRTGEVHQSVTVELKPRAATHYQGILLPQRGDRYPLQPTTAAASDAEQRSKRLEVPVRQMFRSFLQPSCSPLSSLKPQQTQSDVQLQDLCPWWMLVEKQRRGSSSFSCWHRNRWVGPEPVIRVMKKAVLFLTS